MRKISCIKQVWGDTQCDMRGVNFSSPLAHSQTCALSLVGAHAR
jgi:hypothetical protein